MTGLNVEHDRILEIACIVTDADLHIIAEVNKRYFVQHGLVYKVFDSSKLKINLCVIDDYFFGRDQTWSYMNLRVF